MTHDGERFLTKARVLVAVLFVAVASSRGWAQVPQAAPQLANPASQNCVKQGGTLKIERRPDGGQYGVCIFTDNYQCEEWALFRAECPKNGLRVTGYVTPAGRYCAITGGRYTVVTESAAGEQGVCSLPGGKACNAEAYYAGSCGR
jgi:putative hemolysin